MAESLGPRVHVHVTVLDEQGYSRGFEECLVMEPNERSRWVGLFYGRVSDAIDRAMDDPAGDRWKYEDDLVNVILRYAVRLSAQRPMP